MTRRAVGAVRVSRMRDSSTSPEVQEDKIRGWATLHDASLLGIAVDKDVSGKATSPWDRPELGPWMARPQDFDVLVASKIDRVCRDALEFFKLILWAKEHNIAIVFILDGIDLSTPGGELAAKILAVIAEWDWNRIRENTLDGQRKAIQQGRFKGGLIPLGYRTVKESRDGITGVWLVIDEDEQRFVRSLIQRVVSGNETITGICEDYNNRGVLTPADRHRVKVGREPRGAQWQVNNVLEYLRSRALLGEYQTRDDSTLRDETGLPLTKAEPLITLSEYLELQAAIEKISKKRILNRSGSSMLQGVVYCAECNSPMWHMTTRQRWEYYRCSSKKPCGNRMAKAKPLEDEISSAFLSAFSGVPLLREVIIPGEDHTDEIAVIEEQMANLAGNLAAVKPGSAAAAATLKLLEDTEASLAALRALPTTEDTRTYTDTGESLDGVWTGLSDTERGALLRKHEVRVYYSLPKGSAGEPKTLIWWGRLAEMRDYLRGIHNKTA